MIRQDEKTGALSDHDDAPACIHRWWTGADAWQAACGKYHSERIHGLGAAMENATCRACLERTATEADQRVEELVAQRRRGSAARRRLAELQAEPDAARCLADAIAASDAGCVRLTLGEAEAIRRRLA